MAKKRVLQVITRSDWAGGQKVLYSLVYGMKQFHPNEFDVEVACGPHNGMLIPELEKLNVKVHLVKDLAREINPLKAVDSLQCSNSKCYTIPCVTESNQVSQAGHRYATSIPRALKNRR